MNLFILDPSIPGYIFPKSVVYLVSKALNIHIYCTFKCMQYVCYLKGCNKIELTKVTKKATAFKTVFIISLRNVSYVNILYSGGLTSGMQLHAGLPCDSMAAPRGGTPHLLRTTVICLSLMDPTMKCTLWVFASHPGCHGGRYWVCSVHWGSNASPSASKAGVAYSMKMISGAWKWTCYTWFFHWFLCCCCCCLLVLNQLRPIINDAICFNK